MHGKKALYATMTQKYKELEWPTQNGTQRTQRRQNLEDCRNEFPLGKAEADTKVMTLDMIRPHMNEELQNRAIGIETEQSRFVEAMSMKNKERFQEERRRIIENVVRETGSVQYAREKESASWPDFIWATAASHTKEQPKRVAAKLAKCMIDEEEWEKCFVRSNTKEEEENRFLGKKQVWEESCALCGLSSCEPHPGMSMVAICATKGCRHPAMTGEGDRCLGCDTRLSTILNDDDQTIAEISIPETRDMRRLEEGDLTEEERKKKMTTMRMIYKSGKSPMQYWTAARTETKFRT